jgi:hypothetical protein
MATHPLLKQYAAVTVARRPTIISAPKWRVPISRAREVFWEFDDFNPRMPKNHSIDERKWAAPKLGGPSPIHQKNVCRIVATSVLLFSSWLT